jgi:polar amino acid transport system substrate-binding protein
LALKKQKNVFVEKPMAVTSEQLDELCAVREKFSTGLVMAGFNRRFSPHAAMIKDYFSRRNAPMLINYRINAGFIPRNSWLQDQETGGGRIIGEVCHFIDFSSYLTGSSVIEVQATAIESGNAAIVDQDNVAIALKYKDGSVANIVYVAMGSSDLAKEYCEIFADGSNAVMNDFRTTICSGKLGSRKISGKQDKGFSQELEAFFQAVINGKDSPAPWHSLVNTTRVTFAIHEAMANKKTITI